MLSTEVQAPICSICLDGLHVTQAPNAESDSTALKCGHVFHTTCITDWFNTPGQRIESTCPSCRTVIQISPDAHANNQTQTEDIRNMTIASLAQRLDNLINELQASAVQNADSDSQEDSITRLLWNGLHHNGLQLQRENAAERIPLSAHFDASFWEPRPFLNNHPTSSLSPLLFRESPPGALNERISEAPPVFMLANHARIHCPPTSISPQEPRPSSPYMYFYLR